MENNLLCPTTSHTLWSGRIEIKCYGRTTGDWAFRGESPKKAEDSNPGILNKLMFTIGEHVILFAPQTSAFNAKIVHPKEFHVSWRPWLHRGIQADGVVLNQADFGFAIASGDCPTLILTDMQSGLTIATHAGRDCLFDRAMLRGGVWRRDASVVDAAMRVFDENGSSVEHIRGFIACGIGPTKFFHHSNGKGARATMNAQMVNYFVEQWGTTCVIGDPAEGRLALTEIIRGQLAKHGVHPAHVVSDGTDTFNDVLSTKQPVWHSHRRDASGERNLVLVIRHK